MKSYNFFHSLTKQWLNHNGYTFYRGVRGAESEWIVNRVYDNMFILSHAITGATYTHFNMNRVNNNLYQLLVNPTQDIIDTNSIRFPDSDFIFLNQDDNYSDSQLWQVVLDTDNIQFYNGQHNTYLSSLNTTTKVGANTDTVWRISNNVLHHISTNSVTKHVGYDFITPLDIIIVTEGYQVMEGLVWTLLSTDINAVVKLRQPLSTLSVVTLNVETYEEAKPEDIEARILSTSLGSADVICIQEDRRLQTMYIAGYKKVIYCLAEEGIPCTEERPTGCITAVATLLSGEEYLVNSIYVRIELIAAGYVRVDGTIDISDRCDVPRCASFISVADIVIANTHICGGRFHDLKFRQNFEVKAREIKAIVDQGPTIIVGDFNGGYNTDIARHVLHGYDVYRNLDRSDKELFLQYYTLAHSELLRSGYLPTYSEEDIGKTSAYGGVPDWIYYLPSMLTPILSYTVDFIDVTDTGGRLSDHNAVFVKFSIINY